MREGITRDVRRRGGEARLIEWSSWRGYEVERVEAHRG